MGVTGRFSPAGTLRRLCSLSEACFPVSPLEGEGHVEEEGESEEHSGVKPKLVRDPCAPTASEIAEHNASGHVPYRNWCPDCARARGKNPPHKKTGEDRECALPEISVDYCFPRGESGTESITVLVIKERKSQMVSATVVLQKGRWHEAAQNAVIDFIRKLGYKRVIIKSDQEPALIDLVKAVAENWEGEVVKEHSPAHESQSNGFIERAVQSIVGQARVIKTALERRTESDIPIDHPIVTWIFEHAADVLNKYQVGADGRTAYERITGKHIHEERVEFGERVFYRPLGGDRGSMQVKWEPGLWLGKRWGTTEHFISIGCAVKKCRAVNRRPEAERWKRSEIEKVVALPWDLHPNGAVAPRVIPHDPEEHSEPPKERAPREWVPRAVRITHESLVKWGYTKGCPKCMRTSRGEPAIGINHNKECRARIEQHMRETGEQGLRDAEDRSSTEIARRLADHDRQGGVDPSSEGPAEQAEASEGPAEQAEASGGPAE